MTSRTTGMLSPYVRERVVLDHETPHPWHGTTIASIAAEVGCSGGPPKGWVKQALQGSDSRPLDWRFSAQAPTTTDSAGHTAWGLGSSLYDRYNTFLFQPFIDYNTRKAPGGSVSFSTGITANWDARSNQEWTAPLGFAVGKMFRIGSPAINEQVASY